MSFPNPLIALYFAVSLEIFLLYLFSRLDFIVIRSFSFLSLSAFYHGLTRDCFYLFAK